MVAAPLLRALVIGITQFNRFSTEDTVCPRVLLEVQEQRSIEN